VLHVDVDNAGKWVDSKDVDAAAFQMHADLFDGYHALIDRLNEGYWTSLKRQELQMSCFVAVILW